MGKARKNNKKEKGEQDPNQLLNFSQDSYLERTSRPIYAVIFLLPLIVFYEWGTSHFNTDVLNHSQERIVAFVWLQDLLEPLGYGGKFAWVAPPLAVVVILVALQITSGKKWYFWPADVLPMTIECALLAVPLVVLAMLLGSWTESRAGTSQLDDTAIAARTGRPVECSSRAVFQPARLAADSGEGHPQRPLLADFVSGIGAGIYEELVFRLILICVLMLVFQDILRLPHKNSIVLAVAISAVLFSAHHHVDFITGKPNQADLFDPAKFLFRTIAGVYFAALFAIRGFGITAGTHAFHNIISISITARFFQ